MRITRITEANARTFEPRIVELEKVSTYPLGSDCFRIDHGPDYFAFFRRLGILKYYLVEQDGRPAAVGAGVLRDIPSTPGGRSYRAWYLCDLKVHPEFRGRHLPLRLLGRVFLPNYLRCRRGYAISMDPSDGSQNRVVRLLRRFRWLPFRLETSLNIYFLSFDEMARCRHLLDAALGPISFLSLRDKKDLILESTGMPIPLLHVQHGMCGSYGTAEPEPGFAHVLCLPEGDPLIAPLKALEVCSIARASVIAHGMPNRDWRFILTSDI